MHNLGHYFNASSVAMSRSGSSPSAKFFSRSRISFLRPSSRRAGASWLLRGRAPVASPRRTSEAHPLAFGHAVQKGMAFHSLGLGPLRAFLASVRRSKQPPLPQLVADVGIALSRPGISSHVPQGGAGHASSTNRTNSSDEASIFDFPFHLSAASRGVSRMTS